MLPIEQTILIADELGIKHPSDPKIGEDVAMTTDFLLTVNENGENKFLARTIKCIDDLNKLRQVEKFEIERRYWKAKDVDCGIVTEREINELLSKNIKIVHPFYSLHNIELFHNKILENINRLCKDFKNRLMGENTIVRDVSNQFDDDMMLIPGTSIALFKNLTIIKQICIDL